jgi:hypothetical protein
MREPQNPGDLILVNDLIVLRRHADNFWYHLNGDVNTRVDWAFLEHKAAHIVPLQQGEAGWVLNEEWGFVLHPGAATVISCGLKEQAIEQMAMYADGEYIDKEDATFPARPELRHRYYTSWLGPDDE